MTRSSAFQRRRLVRRSIREIEKWPKISSCRFVIRSSPDGLAESFSVANALQFGARSLDRMSRDLDLFPRSVAADVQAIRYFDLAPLSIAAVKRLSLVNRDYLRLLSKTRREGECWIWTAATWKTRGGYGAVWYRGRKSRAHRVMWELTQGPIPEGMEIDHTCGRADCVCPSHLRLCEPRSNRRLQWVRKARRNF